MTTVTASNAPSPLPPGRRQAARQAAGMALMTGSALATQAGAATAALAFPALGPAGVVAVRQWVAAAVLVDRPSGRVRSFTLGRSGGRCWPWRWSSPP